MTLCLTFAQAKPTELADLSLTRTLSLKTSSVAKLSYADVVTLVKVPALAGEQAAAVEDALAPEDMHQRAYEYQRTRQLFWRMRSGNHPNN